MQGLGRGERRDSGDPAVEAEFGNLGHGERLVQRDHIDLAPHKPGEAVGRGGRDDPCRIRLSQAFLIEVEGEVARRAAQPAAEQPVICGRLGQRIAGRCNFVSAAGPRNRGARSAAAARAVRRNG